MDRIGGAHASRRLRDKDRNSSRSALLIIRVRRIGRDCELPEPRSFRLVFYVADPHLLDHGFIADLDVWIDAQIVHPRGVLGRPAVRPDEEIAVALLAAQQRGLAVRTGLFTYMGDEDDRPPGCGQGGPSPTAATLVTLDLLAHPARGARNILCH